MYTWEKKQDLCTILIENKKLVCFESFFMTKTETLGGVCKAKKQTSTWEMTDTLIYIYI